jgi:hypothetical protein
MELEGYGIDPSKKKRHVARSHRAVRQSPRDGSVSGYQGEFFSMPCRNLAEAVQKPHPPMWLAPNRDTTIAAKLASARPRSLVDPSEARHWVDDYYKSSSASEPIGWMPNPNIAMVTGFPVIATRRRHAAAASTASASSASRWGISTCSASGCRADRHLEELRGRAQLHAGGDRRRHRHPGHVAHPSRKFADVGVDQVIFIQQGGKNATTTSASRSSCSPAR